MKDFIKKYRKMQFVQILPLIILLNFFANCEKKSESKDGINSTIIKIKNIASKSKTFEDIFTSIDTIHFEFSENSVLGTISQVCKHPNGYLVLERRYAKEVYLFDNKGKFLKRLGNKGEGPQEYKMPSFIYVDNFGNSYILDRALRKVLLFDVNGSHLNDITNMDLNINPLSFVVNNQQENTEIIFFDPKTGLNNHKFFVFNYFDKKLTFKYSFGRFEKLLRRLPFNTAPVGITATGSIWTGRSLDLDIEMYTIDGKETTNISAHKRLLPKPHISPQFFEGFNHLSDALDTYYKYTRLNKFYFLKDFILGFYFGPMGKKNNYYLIFFENSGKPLDIPLIEHENIFIVGNSDDIIYVYLGIDDTEIDSKINPAIILYKVL